MKRAVTFVALLLLPFVALQSAARPAREEWHFTDVTADAGFAYTHGFTGTPPGDLEAQTRFFAAGVAAGDYDRDGFPDVYVARGSVGPNLLFRNRGDGTFEEVGAAAGVAGAPAKSSGPVFGDIDGDGWLDLVVGAIEGGTTAVYRNRGDGTFADVSASSGLTYGIPEFSTSLGDYDGDGDLDLLASHWAHDRRVSLWQNDGSGHFTDVTFLAGLTAETNAFAPIFADVTNDGRLDIVSSGDFGTSVVYWSNGDGTFTQSDDPALTDENGMGSTVMDYDNDGDLDWFVSSIWDPNGVAEGYWGVTGNRLYRNRGDGVFDDVTDEAGVRQGYWGWGSCFADFDNNGRPDIFHVNGAQLDQATEFLADPARLFLARRKGKFEESAAAKGIADTGQGRGILCFDYDGDGDLDVFIANNGGPPKLYRNDGGNEGAYLDVALRGAAPNTEAIGGRVYVRARATQMREIRAGNNFEGADPAVAHFGLKKAKRAKVCVRWPDGTETLQEDVTTRQYLTIQQPAPPPSSAARRPRPTPSSCCASRGAWKRCFKQRGLG